MPATAGTKSGRRRVISRTARHEAAHAVIAEACGVRVKWVTIVPAEDYAGLCEYDRRFKRGPLIQGVIAMAGTAAEQLWHGRRYTNVHRYDWQTVNRLDVFHGQDWGLLQDMTRIIVRQRKRQIDRIARALMKRGTLTGDEVRELL